MPKNKKEESSSDSDEGPIDRNPPASKKAKMGGKGNEAAPNSKSDGNEQWILQGRKMVRISKFKGTSYIDIREFYEKNGDLLPGKKGISLNPEQWRKLVSLVDDITEALSKSC